MQSNSSYLDIQNSKYLFRENGSCRSPITRILLYPLPLFFRLVFIKSYSDSVNLGLYGLKLSIFSLFFQSTVLQNMQNTPPLVMSDI